MSTRYRITTQRALRREFWATFPHLRRHKVSAGGGREVQHCDTRCTFCDWLDALARAGEISEALASRATL